MAANDHAQRNSPTGPETDDAFYARGEQAWQNYLRTGRSIPVADVFARVEARIAARRDELAGRTERKQS